MSQLDVIERKARAHMNLDSRWQLVEMTTAFVHGIEDHITDLESDDNLDDAERWRELEELVSQTPTVWLPKGWMIITMSHVDDHSNKKTDFVYVGDK